jgi:hypothetical protein
MRYQNQYKDDQETGKLMSSCQGAESCNEVRVDRLAKIIRNLRTHVIEPEARLSASSMTPMPVYHMAKNVIDYFLARKQKSQPQVCLRGSMH